MGPSLRRRVMLGGMGVGGALKYCEKCGQQLAGSVCGFCGQVAKQPVPTEAVQSITAKTTTQEKKFRWLRSDRPKRYLAEMTLVSLVAFIAIYAILPGIQSPIQMEANTEITNLESSDPPSQEAQEQNDFEQPQSNLDEESVPTDEFVEGEVSSEESQDSNDWETGPPPLDDSIYAWIDTWNFVQDPPFIEEGADCLRPRCVYDNFRVTFEPIENFGFSELEGSIEMRTEKDTRIRDSGFKISQGQTGLQRQFLVQSVEDLRNYDGDFYFNFTFFEFYDLISFESDGREFDLLALSLGICLQESQIWWNECGIYGEDIVFDLPDVAENGPHGYPVGYYDIPVIDSCNDTDSIGFDFNGWAATFQAARNAGATQAFVSTQYYAKLFALDANQDGVICSSQAPE